MGPLQNRRLFVRRDGCKLARPMVKAQSLGQTLDFDVASGLPLDPLSTPCKKDARTMTTRNVRDLLQSFPAEVLKDLHILYGSRKLLTGQNVQPLITLMKEQNVSRLESPAHDWFLEVEGDFSNNRSEERKKGNIAELQNQGSVFNYMNALINPYFRSSTIGTEIEAELQVAEELKFGLERDMQSALRGNIEQLEPGLIVIDDGSERTVEAGRIDITARDIDGKFVAIELKAGTARQDSVTQTLAYMASLQSEEHRPVRGILVAADFHRKVLLAARAVPNLELRQYSYSFTFKDR